MKNIKNLNKNFAPYNSRTLATSSVDTSTKALLNPYSSTGQPFDIKPVVKYENANVNKAKILGDNRNKSGVYRWTNKKNGKTYVGSSIDIRKRLWVYYNNNKLSSGLCMPIYRAILKYGYENFSFEILEYCAKEDCVKIETLYIANLKPAYNICQVGRSRLGIKHSLAMRAKISALHKGRIASEEVREKMRLAKAGENHPMFGKTLSEETKAKIGAAHTGKIISEETREKLRIARVGKTYPEETRAKMSMVKVGEKNPNFGQAISEETKAKMRAANGTPVYVLNTETGERNKYASGRETALVLFCNNATVARYLKSGKLFKGIYKISKCE